MIDEYAHKTLAEIKRKEKARFRDLLDIVKNSRTLSKKLKILISLGLVEVEGKLYKITEKGSKALEALEDFYRALKPEIRIEVDRIPHRAYARLLKKYCEILYEYFGERLEGISVFGSVARGDWDKDSDIDLLIVVDSWNKPTWERTRELLKLEEKLRQTEEYRAALSEGYMPIIQEYPLDSNEALTFHRIYIDSCIDGIILYEKNDFLSKIFSDFRDKLMIHGARRVTLPDGRYYWILKDVKAGDVFEL